jgi:hypothetical protein
VFDHWLVYPMGDYLTLSKTKKKNCYYISNWVFDFLTSMVIYRNQAFDFLRISVINPKNRPDIQKWFSAVSNNRPTLV